MRRYLRAVVLCATLLSASHGAAGGEEPYRWKSVQIVGGGFVDGVVFHPSARDVRYARTDIGGAYRWDGGAGRWEPMMDWVPYRDLNLMGVEAIALDPQDARRVYLACGTYTNERAPTGEILRSGDGGKTFQRTEVPFKFGGNEDGRGNGERMAVDPRDGKSIYLGTRHDGLWRSRDGAATWARVTSFPEVTEQAPESGKSKPVRGDGIVFVLFDPARAGTIFVGVSVTGKTNLFLSRDAGESWESVAGEPTKLRPLRAALGPDGWLYVVYGSAPGPTNMVDGAVWKLQTETGAWLDVTPERPGAGAEFGYAGVSVDRHHGGTVMVSTFHRPRSRGGDDLFRSTDGGATWKAVLRGGREGGGVFDYSGAPYVESTPIHWMFDVEIDPANPDHVVFTTGYGGWESFDVSAADRGRATHWGVLARGIEETVVLQLDSPTAGVPLLSAIGDYGGFVHRDLDRPAAEGASAPPRLGNTTGIASAARRPEVVVRVGESAEHRAGDNCGYSLDGGGSWQVATRSPRVGSSGGSVAIAADGGTWVWTPEGEPAAWTRDQGRSWTEVRGLPGSVRVVADPTDARAFYAVDLLSGRLWVSRDGAASFEARRMTLPVGSPAMTGGLRGDRRGGQDRLYAAPGTTGELWLAAANGLYRTNAGVPEGGAVSFLRLGGVAEIHAFGFGRAAPGSSYPALYLVGTVTGQTGIFRSNDEGQTWTRINDDAHQWGLVLQISGDPKRYGRVYVGTHGRGILYGDPAGARP